MVEEGFGQVAVRGEISNHRPAGSGHVYFTLKDEGACIGAVLFRAEAARLKFALKDGLSVVARGRLAVYEARGQYQIICEAIEPEGAGALAIAFEQLKAKLGREGLFDQGRKRRIPFLPRRIGVVTSPSGAAIRDFVKVLHDRFPIPILLAPARVQGEGAAAEVAAAITALSSSGLVDVVVVTRGGGSIEDLWAFNEEAVARAIVACRVPVLSAVGHETDFTIADFVADRRCATPTDAAKTLAPPREELRRSLDNQRRHLVQLVLRQVGLRRERLNARGLLVSDPRRNLAQERLHLDDLSDQLHRHMLREDATRRNTMRALSAKLSLEHPRSRLARVAESLFQVSSTMASAMRKRLVGERDRMGSLKGRLAAGTPAKRIVGLHRNLTAVRQRVERVVARGLAEERLRVSRAVAMLQSLSPLAVLARGYSVAFFRGERRVLSRAADAPPGTLIDLLLSDQALLPACVLSNDEGQSERSPGERGSG